MSEIELKNITKKFGDDVVAVKNLNLKIDIEEFTTLLGPSGCGKSTTLRMIAGLEQPTEGEIWIKGECVYSQDKNIYVPPGGRKLGMVFQSYALWPHLTVSDNISFGLEINKKPRIKEKTKEVAEILEIENLLERYPNELSGGQQQRVAIARVLVMDYDILLLDEPLSNLDAKLRMDMRAELKRLHKELNSTIVYVTHDQLEALTMSSKIAVLNLGKLQQYDSPMEIYNEPENLFTAKFIGNPPINLFEGTMHSNNNEAYVSSNGLDIPINLSNYKKEYKEGDEVTLGIRPEDISIKPYDQRETNDFDGGVYSVLPAGSEWYFKVDIGGNNITVAEYTGMGLQLDDRVAVKFNTNNIKLFLESDFDLSEN